MSKKSNRINSSGNKEGKNRMTQAAAARIQSATARGNNGVVPKDSFAARAQRSAAKNSGKKK